MSFLSKDVGVDLGTANTLVYMKGKGIIMREPSVVAVDTKTDEVRCVGAEAKAVIGRTPGSIVAVRPLKDGVIADFDITANMLENFLKKACGNSMFSRPRVVICIPSGVTEVERRAVREATLKAGARQVSVIEEPMAAAIGAGLPISEPTGSMIVDIGGGTAEIAVISLGGIVASRSVRMAGDMFDQAIIAFIKRKYNLLIGERTAEQIKIEIGSAYPMDPEMTMEIKGRNLVDGLPKNIVVHSEDVREALLECLVKITSAIKETLERTPPELSADIIDHGITLTGGGALLRGLDQLIQSETGIDVHVAEDPLDCVAKVPVRCWIMWMFCTTCWIPMELICNDVTEGADGSGCPRPFAIGGKPLERLFRYLEIQDPGGHRGVSGGHHGLRRCQRPPDCRSAGAAERGGCSIPESGGRGQRRCGLPVGKVHQHR